MAKISKNISIKYKNSHLPENLGEILSNADENDLKILVALMMAADENGEVKSDFSLSEALGDDSLNADAAIKFWRGAGIISAGKTQKTKAAAVPETKEEQKAPIVESAHRTGAVEQNTGVSQYDHSHRLDG